MKYRNLSVPTWHKRFVQQSIWTKTIRNYLFNKSNISQDSYILEVGCGTSAVLSQVPTISRYHFGVDLNYKFIYFGHKNHLDLHLTQSDGQMLPFCSDVFDVVFFHFLLLWVENPEKIFQEAKRVAKKGAKILILAEPDYGGRIDYPPPLDEIGKAQSASLKLQGANPFIGRTLPALASKMNLKNIEHGILGSQISTKPGQTFIQSEWEILKSDLSDSYPEIDTAKYQRIDTQAWREGTRVLFIPTFFLYAET